MFWRIGRRRNSSPNRLRYKWSSSLVLSFFLGEDCIELLFLLLFFSIFFLDGQGEDRREEEEEEEGVDEVDENSSSLISVLFLPLGVFLGLVAIESFDIL